jgi:hypothetical protein
MRFVTPFNILFITSCLKYFYVIINMLLVFLCENWWLSLREIHRLGHTEQSMEENICTEVGKKIIGGLRKLRNQEFHYL